MPADYTYLSVVASELESVLMQVTDVAEPPVVLYNLQLAVHEACVNIIDHAYAGDPQGQIGIRISVAPEPRCVIVELHDTGRSFDPTTVPPPDLTAAQVHGYGLFLMYELLDEVLYTTAFGHNHWRLLKYV